MLSRNIAEVDVVEDEEDARDADEESVEEDIKKVDRVPGC